MYNANESSTYMTSVGKGGGTGGPAKGLAPAHFFPLEGPDANNHLSYVTMLGISWWKSVAHSTAFLLMGRNL